ncbi:MAG: type II toxin-antitoxin system VapC family toxin [Balneolaceae bacterium]|nr:type II toxin-antitoxin system VapC family toxin [Balneolaceae bacterium]
MAEPVIIDTDIFIDFSMDRTDATQTLALLEDQFILSVSVITAMELYSGCRSKRDLKRVDELLGDIYVEFVSESISKTAFQLMKKFRSSHGVEINDMLIAATSLVKKTKMISKNQKHYKFLPDIELLEYPFSRT